jgi:hypothetical protein
MLAPIDKIQNRGNDIMQIVVTTACDLTCSNCTQLIVFRRDYKFMTLDCFEQAVVSMEGWPGVVALFGGNPCVHPQFPELCRILAEHRAPAQRGLWSNHLFKHGQIAMATFSESRLNLNAHASRAAAALFETYFSNQWIQGSDTRASWHAGILMDRRDMGMSDEEWTQRRERCDINQHWSGAILQRDGKPYGYFCEVAGALDGIRGENHGVPAERGWWRQGMSGFAEQVRGCCDRGCGIPLRFEGHRDSDEIYDRSASWAHLEPTRDVTIAEHATMLNCSQATDYMRRI